MLPVVAGVQPLFGASVGLGQLLVPLLLMTTAYFVLNTVLSGIITIDAVGAVEGFNPAAEQIFGYSAEEVLGLQGISTVAEYGVNDVNRLVDLIAKRRIREL